MDQDVEIGVGRSDLVGQAPHRLQVGEVGDAGGHRRPLSPQRRGLVANPVGVPPDEVQRGAERAQLLRGRLSDPRGEPGEDHDPAVEAGRRVLLPAVEATPECDPDPTPAAGDRDLECSVDQVGQRQRCGSGRGGGTAWVIAPPGWMGGSVGSWTGGSGSWLAQSVEHLEELGGAGAELVGTESAVEVALGHCPSPQHDRTAQRLVEGVDRVADVLFVPGTGGTDAHPDQTFSGGGQRRRRTARVCRHRDRRSCSRPGAGGRRRARPARCAGRPAVRR